MDRPPMSPRKCALVTAGSAGLGAAIARLLLVELGMNVTINFSSNADRAHALVQELTEQASLVFSPDKGAAKGIPPPTVRAIQADLNQRSEFRRLVHEATDGPGRLDVVISNFGWTKMRNFADLDDGVDEDDWDRCFGANVKAPLWLFHAARPWLEASNAREAGTAVFVSTASVAGCKPSGSSLVRPGSYAPSRTHTHRSSALNTGIRGHQSRADPSCQISGRHCCPLNTSKQRLARRTPDCRCLQPGPTAPFINSVQSKTLIGRLLLIGLGPFLPA